MLGAHQVTTLNPLGIDDYVPDDPYTVAVNEKENHAYSIIEPVLPTAHPDYKGESARKQKFAYKAGLIFEITGKTAADPIRAYRWKRQNNNDPRSPPELDANGDPVRIYMKVPQDTIGRGSDHGPCNDYNWRWLEK